MGSFALHSCVTCKLLFAGFDAIVWHSARVTLSFNPKNLAAWEAFDFAHGLLVAYDDNKTRFMIRALQQPQVAQARALLGIGRGRVCWARTTRSLPPAWQPPRQQAALM